MYNKQKNIDNYYLNNKTQTYVLLLLRMRIFILWPNHRYAGTPKYNTTSSVILLLHGT